MIAKNFALTLGSPYLEIVDIKFLFLYRELAGWLLWQI